MKERLEDLKARSAKVLKEVSPEVREKLIRFARTSRDQKTGKPSPTKAGKRSFQSTGDANKALACWQLTVILRDFSEEFEKHVSDICQKSHQESVSQAEEKLEKEKRKVGEKKNLSDVKFDLPKAEITLDEDSKKIRFTDGAWGAIDFCEQLVHDLGGFLDEEYAKKHLITVNRETLLRTMIEVLEKNCGLEPFIKALEEKGLRVKICGNCEHCLSCHDPVHVGYCSYKSVSQKLFSGACYIDNCFETCEGWALKEV